MLKIAIDAMGGDNGVSTVIDGLSQAFKSKNNFHAYLVGDEVEINKHLHNRHKDKVTIINCNEVFSMESSATTALKNTNTTIYKTIELVRDGTCDVAVSAGHSGATMSLATLRVGRIKGISRPALATLMPTVHSYSLVLDVGANTDCTAKHLFEFAIMGKIYAEYALDIKEPLVGMLSNGEEEGKGNEATKEAVKLCSNIDNFIGNVEGNDIFNGSVDVIVCDGFIGNILLKTSEGVADAISKIIKLNLKKSLISIAGAVLMKKVFKKLKLKIDYSEYGGALLLGIKKPVIISHGKSNANAIKNAVFQAIDSASSNMEQNVLDELELQENIKS
jgi:glycerol-3-phosphate acyltransferase PlsX